MTARVLVKGQAYMSLPRPITCVGREAIPGYSRLGNDREGRYGGGLELAHACAYKTCEHPDDVCHGVLYGFQEDK